MRRVTLDSNVYISALNFGGKALQVLELARAGKIEKRDFERDHHRDLPHPSTRSLTGILTTSPTVDQIL